MVFEQIRVGGDRNFAYLIGDEETQEAAVVDPAYNPSTVLKRVAAHGLKVVYLINTHGHFDHAGGNSHVLNETNARLIAWGHDGVRDGAQFPLGAMTLTVIHTPGHTDDSICVLVRGTGEPGRLLTGDTLFVGKVGGTDYGAGARTEYQSLHQKLMVLPDDTEVWPGHDYGVAASSTIGHERRTNPFLLRGTFEEFVHLKKTWLEYKRQHGIA